MKKTKSGHKKVRLFNEKKKRKQRGLNQNPSN